MKTCPSCGSHYTDETLRFCLQDGAVLTETPATQKPTESLSGAEMETAVRRHNSVANESTVTRWKRNSEETRISTRSASAGVSGTKVAAIAAVLAVLLILVAGVAGLGLWLYLREPGRGIANYNGNQNGDWSDNNAAISPTPTLKPTQTPLPTTTATATPSNSNGSANADDGPIWILPTDEDKQRISREIANEVASWKDQTESGNIEGLMLKYAPAVDYYRRRAASPQFIRNDKIRAYRMFYAIAITISDLKVAVGASGETASAVFDKEWVFEGKHRSTGKVQQQLQFKRIGGQWLIIGERDMKVYYLN